MTDRSPFDLAPRSDFADRLEADLLQVLAIRPPMSNPPATAEPGDEEYVMTIDFDTRPDTDAKRRTPRRVVAYVAAAAAAIAAVAGLGWAVGRSDDKAASDRNPDGTSVPVGQPVTYSVTWAYSETRRECVTGTPDSICLNRFDIPAAATFAGDIAGPGNQVALWNGPVDYPGRAVDHLEHVVTYNVNATVKGCGDGQFMLVELMQFVSGAERDRDTGTYIGTWQIVPNSGRGALAAISGSGTSSGVFGTAQDVGRSFEGAVACG